MAESSNETTGTKTHQKTGVEANEMERERTTYCERRRAHEPHNKTATKITAYLQARAQRERERETETHIQTDRHNTEKPDAPLTTGWRRQ